MVGCIMLHWIKSTGFRFALAYLVLAAALLYLPAARADVVNESWAQMVQKADMVVFARLVKNVPGEYGGNLRLGEFEILEVVKGDKLIHRGSKVNLHYFEGNPGDTYHVRGFQSEPDWSTATAFPASPQLQAYFRRIITVPKMGKDRYAAFLPYLHDVDELIAHDACLELGLFAPYKTLQELKPLLDHDRLIAAIKAEKFHNDERRLHFRLLGICGTASDIPLLETLLKEADTPGKPTPWLNELVSAYLSLQGEIGLPVVTQLFLRNKRANYESTYSTVMALHFHGTELSVINRDRLIAAMKVVLDRPDVANSVICHLAEWEDWSVLEELFELFKRHGDDKYARLSILNYLQKCPLPRAKVLLKDCERIDPKACKDARTLFPDVGPATQK